MITVTGVRRSFSVQNTKFMTTLGALSGVAVGALAALAVAVPTMQHGFAAQTQQLRDRLALAAGYTPEVAAPAECIQSESAPGQVLGASVEMPPVTAPGAASAEATAQAQAAAQAASNNNKEFVKKLVVGELAKASIKETGPYSSNVITNTVESKVNITNNNNVQISTRNDQSANSGNATVTDNTRAGAATSGDATNSASSSSTLNITNNN